MLFESCSGKDAQGRVKQSPGSGNAMSLAALSRQLVHSKLAEADTQRKLRVSGRFEDNIKDEDKVSDVLIPELCVTDSPTCLKCHFQKNRLQNFT